MILFMKTIQTNNAHADAYIGKKSENDLYVSGACSSEANKSEWLTVSHRPRTAQSNAMQNNGKQTKRYSQNKYKQTSKQKENT